MLKFMNKSAINKVNTVVYSKAFIELLKDKAIIFGIYNKLWIFISSAITAPLIIIYFSPVLQGYYYTFVSLLGIQTLFVMGLGQLIQQFVSHEWANIKYDPLEGLTGDGIALKRLASIKQFTLRWFSSSSIILFAGLSTGGYFFMKNTETVSLIQDGVWLMPWITICALKSVQILISPGLTFLEAINEVESVNRFRFSLSLSERIISWLIILLSGKLWLFSAGTGVNIISQLRFFKKKYYLLLKSILNLKGENNKIWKKEILPLQWRYAISSLSGYLNFSFLIPIIFWLSGPVTAGQAGLTWAIITMFWGLSVTIISTKMPELAIETSKKNYEKVNHTFLVSTVNSTLLLFLTVVLFFTGLLSLKIVLPAVSIRFLEPLPSLILSLSIIPHHLRFAMVSYMRAMKKEPFWNISVLESLLVIVALPLSCIYWGVIGLALAFLGIVTFTTLLTFFIFKKIK